MKRIVLCAVLLVALFASLQAAPPDVSGTIPVRESKWETFTKQSFELDGHPAFVVVPPQPAPGNPWIWRTSFPAYHPEVDIELVKKGFHIAYLDVVVMLGSDQALDRMDRFYEVLRRQWGLAEKAALEPVSRGGLHAYRYAARHPDRVACIYADVPVMDLKSWPLKGGTEQQVQEAIKYYGFKNVEELEAWKGNPLDVLAPIAKAKIPLRHLISPNDAIVPAKENTLEAKRRLENLGWDMDVVTAEPDSTKTSGHHFPIIGVEESVRFILKHAAQ